MFLKRVIEKLLPKVSWCFLMFLSLATKIAIFRYVFPVKAINIEEK